MRQRLREWYWDGPDKQGKKRVDWQVNRSFGPLLKWILSQWAVGERQMVLAMDATSLKKLFVVLSISVVYRGCGIPIAWVVLREGQPGAWKAPWLDLFQGLQATIPPDWLVVVMADRGLYACWLYLAIQDCGWHPFLRINLRSMYRPKGTADFLPMAQLLPSPGSFWAGRVTCFAHNSVEGSLLAYRGAHYKEPWLTLARATRFWLALCVATLWVVNVGGEADANLPASSLDTLPLSHIARRTKKHPFQPRLLSCFTRGLTVIFATLMAHSPIPFGFFLPEPWPLKTYP